MRCAEQGKEKMVDLLTVPWAGAVGHRITRALKWSDAASLCTASNLMKARGVHVCSDGRNPSYTLLWRTHRRAS